MVLGEGDGGKFRRDDHARDAFRFRMGRLSVDMLFFSCLGHAPPFLQFGPSFPRAYFFVFPVSTWYLG